MILQACLLFASFSAPPALLKNKFKLRHYRFFHSRVRVPPQKQIATLRFESMIQFQDKTETGRRSRLAQMAVILQLSSAENSSSVGRQLMVQEDRVKLLFGPYRTPKCKIGGHLRCRMRGKV